MGKRGDKRRGRKRAARATVPKRGPARPSPMPSPAHADSVDKVDPFHASRQLTTRVSRINTAPGRDVSKAAYAIIQWPPDHNIEPVVALQVSKADS